MSYIHRMQNCPVCKQFHSENTKPNLMKIGDFLYGFCKSAKWNLILASSFVSTGKNYYEALMDEAHVATAHGRVDNTMRYLTDRYQSQSLSALVQSIVASSDTCQRVTQSTKPPLGLVTPLHVPFRRQTDILIDFLKLTPVFIEYSTMYSTMTVDDDYELCISRVWTIVYRHSGYKYPIPILHKLKAEKCTHTYEVYLLPYIGFLNMIVFHSNSLFISVHFHTWAASKGTLLEPATAYHQQTDEQTEIVNKEAVTIIGACNLEVDTCVQKVPEIQRKLKSRYHSSFSSSPFHTLYGLTARFGQGKMPYPLNKIVADIERHAQVTDNLVLPKEGQSLQANESRNQPPSWKIGRKVMLSSQNINLPNVEKKRKPSWLGPFPITQVDCQHNNYTLDLSSDADLRHIHKTFHIGLLKPYRRKTTMNPRSVTVVNEVS